MNNKSALGLPFAVSMLVLTSCSSGPKESPYAAPKPGEAPPARQMQPLQTGQPPQKPPKSMFFKGEPIQGGQPGSNPMPFGQPFKLANLDYQFIVAKGGKGYVGLESNPSMKPSEGNTYFLVRYQVTAHGKAVSVPNSAAVHLLNNSTRQVLDIDQAATNANVMSGAATGMPDQLDLNPEEPQIQTLVFQLPSTTDLANFALLVTEPSDPAKIFQIVKLSN